MQLKSEVMVLLMDSYNVPACYQYVFKALQCAYNVPTC